MATVQPFRGWRYNVSQVGSLGDVTAPPYDVINAGQQKELYERHPCNVIRLILNREEPEDQSSDEKYVRAAKFLRHWQSEGILAEEAEDAFYVYHQEFEWEGTSYNRKGFLGKLHLEDLGEGQVYPHEETMSGPKADRLALTKATQMNLSPIFGLYPDPECQAQSLLDDAIIGKTPLVVEEHGVKHSIWTVTDLSVTSQVRQILSDKPIFIADGHHRYETACNYRRHLDGEGQLSNDSNAQNVLMMFVGMGDAGLAILPTHRVISGLPDLTIDDLKSALGDHFEIQDVGEGPEAAVKAWDAIDADGGQDVFGFGTTVDQKWILARLTNGGMMDELASDHSEDWRQLGVAILHRMVVDHLLKQKFSDVEIGCRYVHLMSEVNEAQQEKRCQLAALVPPAGIDHVEQIASRFEKMPPKSTFFYPKLLSGLVFHSVE